jgi:DNA-binding transcriptional MerR regulator
MTTNVISGFTRKETQGLCGVDSYRLTYLDKTDLVKPAKFGNTKKPVVIYSWHQLLEIKAIAKLREEVSLQTVRKILNYLEDRTLSDKQLIVLDGEVFWLNPDEIGKWVVQISGKHQGQITHLDLLILPSLDSMQGEIIEAAKTSKVVDFASFKERAMIA